jgi:hypothetical protein
VVLLCLEVGVAILVTVAKHDSSDDNTVQDFTNFTTAQPVDFGSKIKDSVKPEYPGKTTDLPQVTDKLYQIMSYRVHLVMSRFRTHNVISDRH